MTQKKNLHSSLSVLVAKLYKAEQLYSGMKQSASMTAGSDVSPQDHAPNPVSPHPTILTEYSNDVRSHEWHKVHRDYRLRLNRLISEHTGNSLAFRFENLHELFLAEFEDAEFDLYEAKGLAREAIEKEEFSHLLKLSAEILRRKSRLQAMKVIYDELESLSGYSRSDVLSARIAGKIKNHPNRSGLKQESQDLSNQSSKVIPLMRKASY